MQPGDDAAAAEQAWARVQADPRNHAAWNYLAVAAVKGGRPDVAIGYAERAHQLDRKNGDYLGTLGIALAECGRLDDAIAVLERCVKLRPASADARCNLGSALNKARRYREAREAFSRACAIEPRRFDIKSRLAGVLMALGENAEALRLLQAVHAHTPDDPDAAVDLANALSDTQGVEAAVPFLRRELERLPGEPRLRFRLSQSLLLLGHWEEGWREYAWRPSAQRLQGAPPPEPLPARLEGKRVLLLPNQGLGDMLFFLRFAGDIRERGGRVVFFSPAKLAPLLRGDASIELVASADVPCDFSLGISDLPCAVQAREVRPPLPLRAREDLAARWKTRLAEFGPPPYIALTWRAGTEAKDNPEFGAGAAEILFKEIALDALAGALRATLGTMIAVQRAPRDGEVERLASLLGRPVLDASASNENLEEMTALLSHVDDYIGVSNTNVHIRAGFGLGARVLVPFPPEWRWMASGEQSPWFPGMRVYRESAAREWQAALEALRGDLAPR